MTMSPAALTLRKMTRPRTSTNGQEHTRARGARSQGRRSDTQAEALVDQTLSDADQTLSDADQRLSDHDQTLSATDQASADADQRASDRDQAAADRDHAAHLRQAQTEDQAYEQSRDERATVSFQRLATGVERSSQSRKRLAAATQRDQSADNRDAAARARDVRSRKRAGRPLSGSKSALMDLLANLRQESAADRERAAADRAHAARDRAIAAQERARLEADLRSAHLDALTGAYRREIGALAIAHEIDRVRRSDDPLTLAFVDVDGLKAINDRQGHDAGDKVLQATVRQIRIRLRSYDPIIRQGGDEFVCVLAATDVAEAERRFASIAAAVEGEAGVAISVGFAALAPGDTPEGLTDRADTAMLDVKRLHKANDAHGASRA